MNRWRVFRGGAKPSKLLLEAIRAEVASMVAALVAKDFALPYECKGHQADVEVAGSDCGGAGRLPRLDVPRLPQRSKLGAD